MIIKFLYKLFKKRFQDEMVAEFYGSIPKDIKEPSLTFLANGKEKLEKFFLIQSYYIQRKAMSDLKNAQLYQGMLINIKVFLTAILDIPTQKQDIPLPPNKSVTNYIQDVESFISDAKKAYKETTN